MPSSDIERVVQAVVTGTHYKYVSRDFVRRVAETETSKGKSFKETVKSVKNKLHQVGGAYQPRQMDYDLWLRQLREAAASGDEDALRSACTRIMSHHTSTKERLDFIDEFYRQIFTVVNKPASIIDIACGLNPLAFPWMDLPKKTRYLAVDVYQDMTGFLNGFFQAAEVNGSAETSDVIEFEQPGHVDLALVLKTIPCLEQVDKLAGKKLLERIDANTLIVSFPARSLGGRSKGMVENYEAHFLELISEKSWGVKKLMFPNELVFIVEKES